MDSAPTKKMTSAWMMRMSFCETPASSCMRPAPADKAPNRMADGITAMGLFLASSATAMPVKPNPDENWSKRR